MASREEMMQQFQKQRRRERLSSNDGASQRVDAIKEQRFVSKDDIAELRRFILSVSESIEAKLSLEHMSFEKRAQRYENTVGSSVRDELNKEMVKFNLPVQKQINIPVSIDQGGTGATTAAGAVINLGLATNDTVYFGDQGTNGSWRITKSGNDLSIERRESGSWVQKSLILAS